MKKPKPNNTQTDDQFSKKIIHWLKKNFTATVIGLLLSAIGIVLSILFWINPARSDSNNEPFTATIQIFGWESKQHIPIVGNASIILIIGDKSEKAIVNQQGEAIFKGIPPEYNGQIVPIYITDTENEPYYLADSTIEIHKDKISEIQVLLKRLEVFKGVVIDENGLGIPNATIFVGDIKGITDERGAFQINIPLEKKQHTQEIEIHKDGYTSYRNIAMPMTGDACRIVLSPQ